LESWDINISDILDVKENDVFFDIFKNFISWACPDVNRLTAILGIFSYFHAKYLIGGSRNVLEPKNDVVVMTNCDWYGFEGANTNQKKILDYLVRGMGEGKQYFKSKYIARDLGLSPKEVGTNLKILSDVCTELKIEKWSYSKSTTWRVEPC